MITVLAVKHKYANIHSAKISIGSMNKCAIELQ